MENNGKLPNFRSRLEFDTNIRKKCAKNRHHLFFATDTSSTARDWKAGITEDAVRDTLQAQGHEQVRGDEHGDLDQIGDTDICTVGACSP